MTQWELIEKLENIVNKYNTLYVMGCFGAPLNEKNKKRYTTNHSYNMNFNRKCKILEKDENCFGFDCVNLIKGVIWGWNGDKTKTYGGAVYKSNGCPDISADQMIHECIEISTNFNDIIPGAAVWMHGHIGVYIGKNTVIECTPIWEDGVQKTALNQRKWLKWGKLPYIKYVEKVEKEDPNNGKSEEYPPEWAKTAIDFFASKGYLKGDGKGNYGMSDDMIRLIVIFFRCLQGEGLIK